LHRHIWKRREREKRNNKRMGDRRVLQSSSSEEESSGVESWVEWFCKQEGNEFFCEIDRRYIEDNFNLYGLREVIGTNFKRSLDIILDRADTTDDEQIDRNVQDLYGLIHARFIVTKRGQEKMRRKFKNCEFGVCPRLPCQQQPVLPVGIKDSIDLHGVMVYVGLLLLSSFFVLNYAINVSQVLSEMRGNYAS